MTSSSCSYDNVPLGASWYNDFGIIIMMNDTLIAHQAK